MKACNNCQGPIDAGAQFCGNCGAQVDVPADQAAVSQQNAAQQATLGYAQPPPPSVTPTAAPQPTIPSTESFALQSPTQSAPSMMPLQSTATIATQAPQQQNQGAMPRRQSPGPGQPGFAGIPVGAAAISQDLRGKINGFSIVGIIVGCLYILVSSALTMFEYSQTNEQLGLYLLPIDIILGAAILIPAIIIRGEENLASIKRYATIGLVSTVIVVVFSLISGQGVGIFPVLLLYFAATVRKEIKKIPGAH